MNQSDLQAQLMHSIDVLIPYAEHPTALKQINRALSEVVIPAEDYTNVLRVILRLVNEQQDIMHNPKDQAIKALCLECIERTEFSPTQHPSRGF